MPSPDITITSWGRLPAYIWAMGMECCDPFWCICPAQILLLRRGACFVRLVCRRERLPSYIWAMGMQFCGTYWCICPAQILLLRRGACFVRLVWRRERLPAYIWAMGMECCDPLWCICPAQILLLRRGADCQLTFGPWEWSAVTHSGAFVQPRYYYCVVGPAL